MSVGRKRARTTEKGSFEDMLTEAGVGQSHDPNSAVGKVEMEKVEDFIRDKYHTTYQPEEDGRQ